MLAIDVGGACLKAADGKGWAAAQPFALWRAPERLADELRALIEVAPSCRAIVATMTGELADCFATKAAGVRAIVDALETAAAGRRLAIYLTDGRLVSPDEAREHPLLAAASNWHALAAFATRYGGKGDSLLIDIGSTTADLIPLSRGQPAAQGRTDPERLAAGELVYTGVERTPVCAVVSRLPWRGRQVPVAAELFATTADAYLLLGELEENTADFDTADGGTRTRAAAHSRLARMICADATMASMDEAAAAAMVVCDAQLALLETAARQVMSRMSRLPEKIVVSGHGEFLARRTVERIWAGKWDWSLGETPQRGGDSSLGETRQRRGRDRMPEMVSLAAELGPIVSRCAPAHALAVLARERQ